MEKKRSKGRPTFTGKAMNNALTIRFPDPVMDDIYKIHEKRRDGASMGQTIRELIIDGIDARAE